MVTDKKEEIINKACALYAHELFEMQCLCERLSKGSSDLINVEESVSAFRANLMN